MRKSIGKNIFIGASILAIAGIFSRAIGAAYKIPLTNTLGANGMGVYYLIFPFYSLLLVLSSSGIATAVSSIVAKERALGRKKNEVVVFRVAILYSLVLSLAGALMMILLSKDISLLQGNVNAKLGYIAIAPALVFSSMIAVVRAYFQGLQDMFPTSISYIVEQVVKVVFGLYFAKLFLAYGVEYSVFGAILGVSISELVSFVILIINYFVFAKKNKFAYVDADQPIERYTYIDAFKLIFKYSLPATFSSIIIPITSFFDSFFVINMLTKSGFTSAVATSLYGINNGIVSSLINLPIIFTSALSTAMIPNISSTTNDTKEIMSARCSMFVKVTFFITLPCMIFLIIYAKDIVYLLYSRGLDSRVINEYAFAYKLIIISSSSVLYYGFLQTFTAILQAIGKPIQPLISLLVALIVRFVLAGILTIRPSLNIFGIAISQVIFLTIACLMCLYFTKREVDLKFSIYRMFLGPIFAVSIASIISIGLRDLLINITSIYIYCIGTAVIGVGVYIVMILALKCFSAEEKSMLPQFSKKKKRIV